MAKRKFRFAPLYSGGILCVKNNRYPVVLDIAGMEFPGTEGSEAQIYHQDGSVAGKITRWWVEEIDGRPAVFAEGEFDQDENGIPTPDARDVIGASVIFGKKWDCSIRIYKADPRDVEIIPDDKEIEVNGRKLIGPLKLIHKSRVREGSFVDKGGDAYNNAEIEIAAESAAQTNPEDIITFSDNEISASLYFSENLTSKGTFMPPELKAYIESMGFVAEDLTPEVVAVFAACHKKFLESQTPAPPANEPAAASPVTPPVPTAAPPANAPAAEGCVTDPPKKEEEDKDGEVAASYGLHSHFTPQQSPARDCPKPGIPGQVPSGAPDENRVWTAALLRNAGIMSDNEIAASGKFTDNEMTESMSGYYPHMGIKGMLAMAQERRTGRRIFGNESGFAREALRRLNHPDEIAASVAYSTMNELTILQNVLNLSYRDGYEDFTPVIDKICSVSRTSNFYENKFVSYDIYGNSRERPQGGEIINVTLVSDELVNSLKEYSMIITIDEQMIINDELSAIAKLFRKMGNNERRSKEFRGFHKLLSNLDTLFLSANPFDNPNRGINRASGELGIATLNKAAQLLAEMPTLGSTARVPMFTETQGKYLLVPKGLEATAKTLYRDTKVDLVGMGGRPLETNPHVGEYEPIASSYLGSKMAAFGGSDTHAFLLGDPKNNAVLDVVYLNGENGPRLEEFDTPANIPGKTYRSIFRYGFAVADYRAGVMIDGIEP